MKDRRSGAEYVKTSRSKAALFILYKYMFVLYSMG